MYLKFINQKITGNVSIDGQYIFHVNGEEPGSVGYFAIIYNSLPYHPSVNKTITVEPNIYLYNIDLYFKTSDSTSDDEQTNNLSPIADAGGPYYEIVTIPVEFNGSESYDTDGTIIEYLWDFGDGHSGTGDIVNHEYTNVGKYNITLKVIDNNFDFNVDTSYAIIIDTLNNPPKKPNITGASSISVNELQNYSAVSTDPDNDSITYLFDWGDESEVTQTAFISNGTIAYVNHSWKLPGLYQLSVSAEDEKGVRSESTLKNILVDTIFCSNIGLLIDYTNDGILDFFQSNITNKITSTVLDQNGYLIDIDGDSKWDFVFDVSTQQLDFYSEKQEKFIGFENIPLINIIILATILLFAVLAIYLFKSFRKKSQSKSVYYIKEKTEEDKEKEITNQNEKTDIKEIKSDDIEKQIDEFLSKK